MGNLKLLRADDWRFRGEQDWIVRSMTGKVREMDRREWELAGDKPFFLTLARTVEAWPTQTWAVVDGRHGHCLAMWGVEPTLDEFGYLPAVAIWGNAWMVATPEAVKRAHSMHRFFKQGIADMHALYPTLLATSYAKNTVHHDWMLRMGFMLRVPMVINGHDYLQFIRRVDA